MVYIYENIYHACGGVLVKNILALENKTVFNEAQGDTLERTTMRFQQPFNQPYLPGWECFANVATVVLLPISIRCFSRKLNYVMFLRITVTKNDKDVKMQRLYYH